MSTEAAPLLRIRGAWKSFPGVQAVRDVDFDVVPGEVHALVGQNGAGKSTLIKLYAGVERPDEGTIEIAGEEVHLHNADDATRRGLAFIHQELNVVPNFSAIENITLGLKMPTLAGVLVNWRQVRKRVRAVADRLSFDFDVGQPVKELSQAQKQLVAVGRALLLDARVVTMDEPTAALADAEVERLYSVIADLRAAGVGVVYVSHRLEEVFRLADRVTVMRDGKKVGTFARDEVRDKHHLAELIIGRENVETFHERTPELGPVRIAARDVSWRNRVKGVDLEIRSGEIVGLGGLVGAGRSELAHLLFGAEKPDRGEVAIDGTRISGRSPSRAIRRGTALLPEDRRHQAAITTMTVRENTTLTSLGRYLLGPFVNRARERQAVNRLVERLGIKVADIDDELRTLSGGNQQKVVIAKWIDTGAGVYLFDEPTQGVDVGAKAEIHRIIEELAAEGAAVLFISSDLEEVAAISDRVLVMREGELVAELPRGEATVSSILAHCYATAHPSPTGKEP